MTPERVSLGYDLAGIGSRAAAALIDVTVQAVMWVALLIVLLVTIPRSSLRSLLEEDPTPGLIVAVLIVVLLGGFFLLWGYYLVFEIIWSGQTPGKRMLGLRVIRENGYPIRPGDAVVRNLIRMIDGPPFAAPLGALVMLLNARSKRLGDFAAGTIVVREGNHRRLAEVLASAGERPASAPPGAHDTGGMVALRAEDATLVRDFLVRRREMEAAPRQRVARRLAAHLARQYGLEASLAERARRGEEEAFLAELANSSA